MAKFCGNCGSRWEDAARVCGNCGTPLVMHAARPIPTRPVPAPPPERYGYGVGAGVPPHTGTAVRERTPMDPAQAKKMKKIALWSGIGTAILIVLIVVIALIASSGGHSGVLDDVMEAYEVNDIERLIDMSSDAYYYGSSDGVDRYFENAVSDRVNAYQYRAGYGYRFSYDVVRETRLTREEELWSFRQQLNAYYPDFDASVIEEVMLSDIVITIRQGAESFEDNIRVTLTKEPEGWKVLYID